jgi:DNA-directed RNA polymerase specialized sigma24 family protein
MPTSTTEWQNRNTEDLELAQRFLASPAQFREEFAERCTELLKKIVRRKVCREGKCPWSVHRETFADDVFSRALYKLTMGMCQLRSSETFHVWLNAIAGSAVVEEVFTRIRRICKSTPPVEYSLDDVVERAAREPKAAHLLQDVEAAGGRYRSRYYLDPERLAEDEERLRIYDALVTAHAQESVEGAECAAIVRLRREGELSVGDLAKMLSRPKSTVHLIILNNMRAYKEMYDKRRVGRPAGSAEAV